MEVRVRRSEDRNDQLFHSDTFLGEEFSDELYHWKYVKREKLPSGKYRYYYDKDKLKDDIGYDEKARYKQSKLVRDSYKKQEDESYDRFKQVMDIIDRDFSGKSSSSLKNNSSYQTATELARQRYSETKQNQRLRKQADERVEKALAEYKKTPMYKIDRVNKKIEQGKNKVRDLLHKLKKR